jgi:two-component system, NarL family, nitrate/nitrite response regulator NarL
MSAPTAALADPEILAAPRVALRVRDAARAAALRGALIACDEADADVMVIELARGEALPEEVAAFDGAVLVLSDDPAHAADTSLQGVLPLAAPTRQVAAAVLAVAWALSVRVPMPADLPRLAPAEPAPRPLLTPRELEVLALVGEGLSNKAIARRLGISAHTVKYHLEAIFAKLGVRSRAEAITRGLRLGVQVL